MIRNKKKLIISITAVTLCIIAGATYVFQIQPYFKKAYSGKVWTNTSVTEEEELIFDFVNNDLTNEDGGIRTNYIDEESDGDITKGHSVLSESEGIMLLYYLERNDKEKFDETLKYIENNMILDNGLLSWTVKDDNKNPTSATIDDLRVVKALLLAQEKWDEFDYRKLALKISNGIHKELLNEDILTNFNDGYNKSDGIDLCYLDLPTLRMLSNIDYFKWKKVYDKSTEILNNGYISDEVPLYRRIYYINDNKYDDKSVETIYSMIVILNRLQEQQDVTTSIEWIRKELKEKGKIFAIYDSKNGEPLTDIESTSIYAYIVEISTIINDKEMQDIALKKMKSYQIKNKDSVIYGGYGAEDGTGVHSFDNLNALLSYRNRIEY